jgi:hypothetical protein
VSQAAKKSASLSLSTGEICPESTLRFWHWYLSMKSSELVPEGTVNLKFGYGLDSESEQQMLGSC